MLRNDKLLLIDAIGPFFRHCKKKRINWSKAPFSQLETENGLRSECVEAIPRDFRTFAQTAVGFGYNAITLDDVASLIVAEFSPGRRCSRNNGSANDA